MAFCLGLCLGSRYIAIRFSSRHHDQSTLKCLIAGGVGIGGGLETLEEVEISGGLE